jgi:hypothetical protein
MKRLHTFLLCLAATACLAAPASAGESAPSAITKGETCPYKISTKHFDIEFSVPPAIGKVYGALCEKAYSKFSDVFQVAEDDVVWEGKCKIYLFKKQDEFAKFAAANHGPGAAMSGGYALPTKQDPTIVLFLRGQDHVKLQQVVIHEMTHVFLQLFKKEIQVPTWLHEGFAQLFEFQHHPGDSRLTTSKNTIKRMVSSGNCRPLKDFWVSPFPATDFPSYAQAWSLLNFMTQTKDLRKKTGQFVLALKDKAPEQKGFIHIETEADLMKLFKKAAEDDFKVQAGIFKDVFGFSAEELEARWKRYVLATQ